MRAPSQESTLETPLRNAKEDFFGSVENLKGKVDFAIITIKEEELQAVLEQFPRVSEIIRANRDYAIIRVPLGNEGEEKAAIVAVTRCPSQGNGISQDVARDIIGDLDPQWLLVVGIAGGTPSDEFTLGDVVIASSLVDTTVEAVSEQKPPAFAAEGRLVHPAVENLASMVQAYSTTWGNWHHLTVPDSSGTGRVPLNRPPVSPRTNKIYGSEDWKGDVRRVLKLHAKNARSHPIVRAVMIASSDRLIKDDKVLATWMCMFRQIRAVEMESSGVYLAARGRLERPGYPAVSIRGISDIVGLKRDSAWTRYACVSAAAFTHAFVRSGYIKPRSSKTKHKSNPADDGISSDLESPASKTPSGIGSVPVSAPVATRPRIRIDVSGSSQLLWSGSHNPVEFVSTCWGAPDGDVMPRPGELAFEPAWRRHKALTLAIIRLGVHGGLGVLYVSTHNLWMEAIKTKLPGCIGTPEEAWEPREGLLGSSQQWCVSDLDTSLPYKGAIVASHDADSLASELHSAMDAWVMTRLDELVARITSGMRLLPYPIHGDFLPGIESLWRDWSAALSQSPDLRRHFLTTMLAVSDVHKSHDGNAPLIRLGPRTAKSCVLEAVIFAMAIEIATRGGTVPHSEPRINLKHASQNAQLFGLQLIERYELDAHFGHLVWEPGYAFIAHACRPASELRALSRRFSEPDEVKLTLGRSDDTHVTLIPRDGGFLDGLRNGPEALAKHLAKVIVAQDQSVKLRVMQSLQASA
ncbi:ABC-three component system protein [Sorangium sp. So ce291]|uniref:ABC-three component system protein n=1 Tax=Sorangium sp. So ce291 TaxID=3133294 RepID=UPI003F60AFFD